MILTIPRQTLNAISGETSKSAAIFNCQIKVQVKNWNLLRRITQFQKNIVTNGVLRQLVIISINSEMFSAKHFWLQRPIYILVWLLIFPALWGFETKEKGRLEVLFCIVVGFFSIVQQEAFWCNYFPKKIKIKIK